jgi:hypothetical protein
LRIFKLGQTLAFKSGQTLAFKSGQTLAFKSGQTLAFKSGQTLAFKSGQTHGSAPTNNFKMKKYILFSLLCLPTLFFAQNKAQKIIKKSIKAHGGKQYDNFSVSLDFRQFHLVLKHNNGKFHYERTTTDSTQTVWRDVLTNEGFHREKNGTKIELSEKDFNRYLEGINSQAYFLLLPYKLNDKSVISTFLGEGEVEGKKQYKIKIAFQKEGGGIDHEDVFCYWINQKTYLVDYIAYANGGPRFRKATTRHTANGIIFQDYENYEIKDKKIPTDQYDRVFTEGGVKLLSKIEHRNFQ